MAVPDRRLQTYLITPPKAHPIIISDLSFGGVGCGSGVTATSNGPPRNDIVRGAHALPGLLHELTLGYCPFSHTEHVSSLSLKLPRRLGYACAPLYHISRRCRFLGLRIVVRPSITNE